MRGCVTWWNETKGCAGAAALTALGFVKTLFALLLVSWEVNSREVEDGHCLPTYLPTYSVGCLLSKSNERAADQDGVGNEKRTTTSERLIDTIALDKEFRMT